MSNDTITKPVHWVSKTVDERRSIAYTTLEIRKSSDENTDGSTFDGYAAIFDSPSEPMMDWNGGKWTEYVEYVRKGAFAKTLNDGADVRFLVDHYGVPLARTKSGTLTLDEDDFGLHVVAPLDIANPDAARIISALDRGDISQMSFAFRVVKDKWSPDFGSRELIEVQLFDVSVVTYPAYADTVAEIRSAKPAILPSAGFSLLRKRQIEIARHR